MRRVFGVLVIAISSLLSSCSSDSDSSKFTAEERELRTLLNHEWEATDAYQGLTYELPLSEEYIADLLNFDWSVQTGVVDHSIVVGMNKKGGFYFIDEKIRKENGGEPLQDLFYSCTSQQGNKFTGVFSGMSVKGAYREFYVRKVDENTMNLVIVYKEVERDNYAYGYCSVYAFKKIGAWDEQTTFRKIFQRYRYYDNMLDKMILAEENYERDLAQGSCQ
ncbi:MULTISPECIES: hypothetical protein [unclassified Myroides]|uniref:hypothetical protein n=1 Tax=unclassified Myroides TaxID=2642485 RepID=UPI003D2F8544